MIFYPSMTMTICCEPGVGAAAPPRSGEEDLQCAEQAARQDLQQDHWRQRGGDVGGRAYTNEYL